MNKIKTFLTAMAVALLAATGWAQTNAPATNSILGTLWGDISTGIGSVSNYAVAPYLTYAPSAPKKVGGGVLAIYNLSKYVGAGVGVDYLGQFSLVSGNVQLQVPTHPLSFISTNSFLANLTLIPFVLGGIATPMSGAGTANGGLASVEAVGGDVDFLQFWGGNFGVGAALANWTGAGEYSGKHDEFFVKWSKGF
jgi:hypothetical protein